jgi:photosystem II stability/assembly factor-like uncharacterized protein
MRSRHLVLPLLLVTAGFAPAQSISPDRFTNLKWRSIGPYRGGRSIAAAGSLQRPQEYYFGATGGGIWKTTDGGENWTPVADDTLRTATVGAVAIAPSNPDIVVAGTGERDIRGNISHGDGAYRTVDGGKTWRHIGLEQVETISRIVIHPKDPETMWVAALGHVYGKNKHGGIYKTTDGGRSWTRMDDRGAVDIVLDPANPDVLLAATWDGWRTAYTLNSGGENSRLLKSVDGGRTWSDLSRAPGMPPGLLGKIGVAISPVDSKRYWAMVESLEGGLFRSDDAGATWEKVNDDRQWRQRAWYYTHVYADPKEKDTVYLLNVGMGRSTDGGKTFRAMRTPHSDNHDLWIAPDNPKRMINANDGGANVSVDGGANWTEQDIPTGQFYHVTTDDAFPYRILGAQQDNSTVRIPSRTFGNGIGSADWTSTAGGESGYIAVKPGDPDIVFGGSYGGDMSRVDHRTNLSRQVDPWPDNPMGHGAADLVHRFQWTYPIVFSPHDRNTLYTCSQYVLRSRDEGQSWVRISPDLTRNDKSKMGPSGGPITKDNTSVEYYGTVFTFAESPRRRGVLWAGSDDGLVHVSQDGGRTWRNVTPKGMPTWGLVSMIEPSPHHPAVAFVAVDNHENDDLAPYAYMTEDYGQTWRSISGNLPRNSFVRVVREDHRRPKMLYAGTETGVWLSHDAGRSWQSLRLNMPVTPIHDLVWKEDDLVVATHGRGFWVLDDLSPLRQLAPVTPTTPLFYAPRDAWRVRFGSPGRGNVGANPPSGVQLNYFLPADVEKVRFEFSDARGRKVSTLESAPSKAGFQRVSTWLQEPSWRRVPGMTFWSGSPSPITLPPGEYTVRMFVNDEPQGPAQKFRFVRDPRSGSSDRDLVAQYEFVKRVAARLDDANGAVEKIRKVRAELETAAKEAPDLTSRIGALVGTLTTLEERIYQTKMRSGQDPLNYPIRINDKLSGVFSTAVRGEYRPTEGSIKVFEVLSRELAAVEKELGQALERDLKAVNEGLRKAGKAEIKPLP